jgi:hypothetical protein
MTNRLYFLLAIPFAIACEPKLVAGTWDCPEITSADAGADPALDPDRAPVVVPWSSGFEDGFCGFKRVGGFCYQSGDDAFTAVTSPVHSGKKSAAFQITAVPPAGQARCVRRGQLPSTAYYGAWYNIPVAATDLDNWNLFHFQGGEGEEGTPLRGLWDVTITPDDAGTLRLSIYDFLHTTWHHAPSPVPFGTWFHIQVYLKRAADTRGAFALYQDGELAVDLQDLVTDDSTYGQWYVGNLARNLTPSESTLYVDDVTISDTL